jgi:hypothetical protein
MEPQYLNGQPLVPAGIISGEGIVTTRHHGGASDEVSVLATSPVTLQFYTYFYPGWQVTLNGAPIEHRFEPPFGLITVDLPAGEHVVRLQMGSTPARTYGTILSGLGLLIIAALLLYRGPKIRPPI